MFGALLPGKGQRGRQGRGRKGSRNVVSAGASALSPREHQLYQRYFYFGTRGLTFLYPLICQLLATGCELRGGMGHGVRVITSQERGTPGQGNLCRLGQLRWHNSGKQVGHTLPRGTWAVPTAPTTPSKNWKRLFLPSNETGGTYWVIPEEDAQHWQADILNKSYSWQRCSPCWWEF